VVLFDLPSSFASSFTTVTSYDEAGNFLVIIEDLNEVDAACADSS